MKLTRALWIVPVTVGASIFKSSRVRLQVPMVHRFILLFLVAAVIRSYAPHWLLPGFGLLVSAAKIGLALTLFLIGASLSRDAIRRVGIRPLVQGVVLSIVVALASIYVVRGDLL